MGTVVGNYLYDCWIMKGRERQAMTISFDSGSKEIRDSANRLDQFTTGDSITVSGAGEAGNNRVFTIAAGGVAAKIVVNEAVTDEAAGQMVQIAPLPEGLLTVPTSAEFRRRANDFAPVISQPGMQLEYAEDVWRPWTMGDFRGGFGQENWDDPTRFAYMAPGLRIYKNRISLDTQFANEVSGDQPSFGVDFKGDHYAKAGNTVRKRTTKVYTAATISFDSGSKEIRDSANGLEGFVDGDTIIVSGAGEAGNNGTFTIATGGVAAKIVVNEAVTDEAAGESVTITGSWNLSKDFTVPCTGLCVFGDALYASTWGDYYWWTTDGEAWTKVAAPTGIQYQRAILSYRKFLWIAQDWTLYFNATPKVATTWMEPIIVGGPDSVFAIQGLAVIGGVIAIGRTNGIYIYEGSGDMAEGPIIDFENQDWVENCKLFTVADGFLYYNVGHRVKKTDLRGSEFDVTPVATVEIDPEYRGFGAPMSGQGRQGHLYVGFTGIVAAGHTYPTVMEMPTIDIGGWRTVYNAAADATLYGVWFSDAADRLIVNDGTTRTQRHQPYSDAPYPDYIQTSYLVTSLFDAGDAWSKKLFDKILAYARDLTATETIKVEYEADLSGIWITICTLTSGIENREDFDPITGGVSARKGRLRITLSRDAGDSTKKPTLVLPLVASFMVRPNPVYAQQLAIRLEEGIQTLPYTGGRYTLTNSDVTRIKGFLRDCEGYPYPLHYTDRNNQSWEIVITRTEELRAFTYPVGLGGDRRQEDVMMITMREL